MIFPELPRHHHFYSQQQTDIIHYQANKLHNNIDYSVELKTPLRGSTIDQYMASKGWIQLSTDPAAAYPNSDPVDWFAKDAWEFYALCVFMVAWISVWLGIHRGWW